jgi:hypothetical protein
MKIRILVAILAVAAGTAFAQSADNSSAASTQSSSGGVVDKTKNALHRAGNAVRNGVNRVAHAGRKVLHRDDTSSTQNLGASGSGATDNVRQGRMDQAYDTWKSKQK